MNKFDRDDFSLRPMAEADLERVLRWRNSERVRQHMFNSHIITPDEHRAWFERIAASDTDCCLIFGRDDTPLGLTSFSQIHPGHRRAYWGFYIGEDMGRERGLGTHLGRLSLDYAFDELNLHKVIGEVLPGNDLSLRLFRRLGFKEEGILQDEIWRDGAPIDVVRFAMLEDDWRRLRGEI